MNEKLNEAILRMAAALEGATEAMTKLIDALPYRDIEEDDEDREPFEDANLAALAFANQNRWQLYRDHFKATVNGTEFRAALLGDGYPFEHNHSNFEALKQKLESVDFAKVTFNQSIEGVLSIDEVTFNDFSATTYGCVIFSDIGPIAYLDFHQPQCSNGGRLTIRDAAP